MDFGLNKRAFLERLFSASTVAYGGLFMWQRINLQPKVIIGPRPLVKRLKEDPLAVESMPHGIRFTALEL